MTTLYFIFIAHFIADFIVQTSWQAQNKSSNLMALSRHISTYTLCLLPFGWKFALVNGAIHFIVDFITSRISKKSWEQQKQKQFWVVIGMDQLIHILCLTWVWEFFL